LSGAAPLGFLHPFARHAGSHSFHPFTQYSESETMTTPSIRRSFLSFVVMLRYDQHMPSLSPTELQEARRRSGRLGGRPRKPTVEEARRAALEELTPRALKVLRAHLGDRDEVNPHAWRAALRIFEHAYGRAPDQPLEPDDLPEDPDEIANLSWDRLRTLAARYSVELDGNGDAGQEARPPAEI
jgi:hypothetical protein